LTLFVTDYRIVLLSICTALRFVIALINQHDDDDDIDYGVKA